MLSPERVREITESFNQVAPSAIYFGPRGLHAGGAGHRRCLVAEGALSVVDASAVAVPNSHVIPDVVESDVFVFDPLDSDEEDGLDALSRNATGAPGGS